jgi:hypothetical protein
MAKLGNHPTPERKSMRVGNMGDGCPMPDDFPLVLTRPEAAAMCRVSMSGFDSWVRRGIIPGPIPGTRRWSRIGIERALAGEQPASGTEQSHFDQWKRERANAR